MGNSDPSSKNSIQILVLTNFQYNCLLSSSRWTVAFIMAIKRLSRISTTKTWYKKFIASANILFAEPSGCMKSSCKPGSKSCQINVWKVDLNTCTVASSWLFEFSSCSWRVNNTFTNKNQIDDDKIFKSTQPNECRKNL